MSVILWVLFLLIITSAAVAGMSAAPWLPTLPSQRKHLLNNLQLQPEDKVVDLGCGDGSMLFAVARLYPDTVCVGYDISLLPLMLGWSRKLIFFRAYKNVHINFGNLFKQDVREFNVIFVFLLSKCYPKLIASLSTQVAPTTKIIVEAWPLPQLQPQEILTAEKLLPVYIYSGHDLQVKR
ncbi:MAG: class I SAM-dependent methyltransferase [Patescibacteria group bacterium]